MKHILGLLLLVSFSQSAQAADEFTVLADMFTKSALPVNADLDGRMSGRCFLRTAPRDAECSLIAGWVEVGPSKGPLFPGKDEFKAIAFGHPTQRPDFFDDLTPEKADEVDRFISSNGAYINPVMERDNALALTNTMAQGYIAVRKSQEGYLVGRIVDTSRPLHISHAYCYWFGKGPAKGPLF